MSKIICIEGIEVIDSRGNPTVEVKVCTEFGASCHAIVPSGASTGEKEAIELRDNDKMRFNGKGVLKAINNVNKIIAPELLKQNFDVTQQIDIDKFLIKLDGTPNKSKLGANAILGVSLACAKAAANELEIPLYRYFGGLDTNFLPIPMLNVINGGAHADNDIDFQEFMIVPIGANSFKHAVQMSSEIYHCLKKLLKDDGHITTVGDEGGFAPNCKSIEEVLDYLIKAIKKAGYFPAKSGPKAVAIALDPAVSELYIHSGDNKGKYLFKKLSKKMNSQIIKTTDDMIKMWVELVKKYPIISIEDGLGENDWEGFSKLNKLIGDTTQLVGDDIFVTNPNIIKKGIDEKVANSVLIKLNQIGTLTETIEAIKLAQKASWTAVVSHRSGETEDTTIADLSVGFATCQIKTGSMSRTDRIAKFNRLIRIEKELGKHACYLGAKAFYNINKK